jgi:DNA-binding transcriptional LysR family regulator
MMVDNTAMNLRSLDLNLLVVFDAILVEGSLSRAADRIGMSQPAMSNALARLRVALKDPLFERRGNGMEPTVRARQLANPIRQALDVLQAGLSTGSEFDFRTAKRSFSIATEDFGEVVIMPRLMNWLSSVAPSIQVRIASERATAGLNETRRGKVDIALDYIPIDGDELAVQQLMAETRVCVARNGHPRVVEGMTLETYLSLAHIVLNRKIPGGAVVSRELARRGLVRNIAMEVPHYLSMPAVLLQTDFVSTMPRRVAQVIAEHYGLKMVKLPLDVPDMPIYMSWNKAQTSEPAHRWFRDSVGSLCQRL